MYQNRSLFVKTAPAVEPVLIGDVKKHLRVWSASVGGAVSLAAAPTGVSRTNGVVTVTPAAGQPLPSVGQTVTLAGIADASFNGSDLDGSGYVVQSVGTPAGAFTINQPGPNATSGAGTYQVTEAPDESVISGLITAARITAEVFTRRALITQTLIQYMDHWPRMNFIMTMPKSLYSPHPAFVRMFRAPLQSVTSIKYTDAGGTQQTWDPTNYIVDTASEPGRISLAFGKFFPPIRVLPQSIVIEYVAGYGATQDTVPEGIRLAIKMLAAHWYQNRTAVIAELRVVPQQLPMAVEMLLWNHRVMEF